MVIQALCTSCYCVLIPLSGDMSVSKVHPVYEDHSRHVFVQNCSLLDTYVPVTIHFIVLCCTTGWIHDSHLRAVVCVAGSTVHTSTAYMQYRTCSYSLCTHVNSMIDNYHDVTLMFVCAFTT